MKINKCIILSSILKTVMKKKKKCNNNNIILPVSINTFTVEADKLALFTAFMSESDQ